MISKPAIEIDALVQSLEANLARDYAAFHPYNNPVLRVVGAVSVERAREMVAQYFLLPARIVEFLGAMAYRLRTWHTVHEELLENIAQECGSITMGRAHVIILRDCLQRELHINVSSYDEWRESTDFLGATLRGIHSGSTAFVAGMAFALEASAVPELEVVASLVNEVASLAGISHTIAAKHKTAGRDYAKTILEAKRPEDYSLEDFLVVHLLAIEVEHRDGLKRSVAPHLSTERDIEEFERGFSHLLALMEEWWRQLARSCQAEEGGRSMNAS